MSLKIYLLGQFKLQANDIPLELLSRPAQSLLAYLALNSGMAHRREKLAALIWPEATETNARSYLRQALWRIRKSLEGGSLQWEDYLQINDISVTFNDRSDYWLDADLLVDNMESRPVDEIIEIVGLYRGELLPGFYEEWIIVERERLLAVYHQTMNQLLEVLIQLMRWNDVLKWGEQWIRLGFSPEPAYRGLIKAYAGLGNLGMIPITFQRCVDALKRDLGVEPSPETVRLYEQFLEGKLQERLASSTDTIEQNLLRPFFFDKWKPLHVEKSLVVAREQELEQLNNFLDLAVTGQGRVVFVTGEAGSGKTTLINEFTRRAQITYKDLIVVGGNCNAHTGIGDPYLPFREILELLTGNVESLWLAGAVTQEYAQFLWNLIPITVQTLMDVGIDLIDTFISGETLFERAAAYAAAETDWLIRLDRLVKHKNTASEIRSPHQSDLFIQYSKLLRVLSRRAPLILVIDDMQWADLGSISLLFHISRYLTGSRILIVGAYRPEEIALGRAGERHPLEPVINEIQHKFGNIDVNIDTADCHAFIDAILDCEPNQLGYQFRDMLCQLTLGHPLFTIELLRGMQERGDLVKDNKYQWVEGPALNWDALPSRVEAVIAERVARLDPLLQKALRTASIEGELFTAEAVARVQGLEVSELLSRLSNELDRKHRIIRAQSIQRINGQLLSSYRFRHILVQKYLYNSMDEVERVYLHERIGNVLEELFANQITTIQIAPQLARHFEEARVAEKAIYYLHQSGEAALRVSAYQEAINHLNKGLALLASLPDSEMVMQQELSLQLTFSMALHFATGATSPEMKKASIRAFELCKQVGSPTQLCLILSVLSIVHYVEGAYHIAHELANELFHLGTQAGDQLLIGLGHWCLGIVLFGLGKFHESRYHLEQVVSYYESQKHHKPFILLRGVDAGLSSLSYLACCLWSMGYPEQAEKRSQEALKLAHELDHSFSLVDVLRYAGCEFNQMRRDARLLKVNAEELIRLSQAKDFPAWLESGKYCLGEALILLDQLRDGISLIREGVDAELSMGVRCSIPGSLLYLAEGYARLGELDQALRSLSEAFDLIGQTGEGYWEAELLRMKGELFLAQQNEAEAEVCFLDAIRVAQQQDAKSLELRATTSLARLWQGQGRGEDANKILSEIYYWFSEGFTTPDLKEAKLLLDDQVTGGRTRII